jgi:glycosyltransferase involved in cell wall biosynthesis
MDVAGEKQEQAPKMVSKPLVSVLMPCYKGNNYLRRALDSCLAQTYSNFEIVAVDDNSPDDTLEIFREYAERDSRIRVFARETNGGQGRAFQTALENSRGEYITRLAHDDLFYPAAIETLVQGFQGHPEAGLVYGDMVQIDEDDKVLYTIVTEEPERALLPCNRVGLYTMWRREVHEKAGGFVADSYAEDYDLWLQISLHHKLMKVHAAPQLGFRLHAEQASQNNWKLTRATIQAHLHYNRELAKRRPFSPKIRLKILKGHVRYQLHQMRISRGKRRGTHSTND